MCSHSSTHSKSANQPAPASIMYLRFVVLAAMVCVCVCVCVCVRVGEWVCMVGNVLGWDHGEAQGALRYLVRVSVRGTSTLTHVPEGDTNH